MTLLYIHDINAEATKKFVDEMAGYAVRIARIRARASRRELGMSRRTPTDLYDENPFSFTE